VPAQCPACGRFLKKDLVESLAAGPAPCPRCGQGLEASMFDEAAVGEATATSAPPAHGADEVAAAHAEATSATSPPAHRADETAAARVEASASPPDATEGGAATDRDPLAGWDVDRPTAPDGLGSRRERELVAALPPEEAAVAVVAGALLGALVSRRRGIGALIGAVLAVVAGALARAVRSAR
jgi:hypothetical protein